MSIDYAERIPNNVGLADDRRLRRALESWLPSYLDWWRAVGPPVGDAAQVYLRTAVGVDAGGWAHYDFVAMPDYRWGIFLTPPEAGRTIGFGAHKGDPAWSELPGEYRAELRRLIVTQGDTEPASVEQQTTLGVCCPSLYDLRNLYQVNVEEGRHLWAMVYLLHAYFGRDGREEADELLERHSGDPESRASGARWFAACGVRIQRVMSDNAFAYTNSRLFKDALKAIGARHITTRPYTPRTNGKAERFIQTALREWLYAKSYNSSANRTADMPHWIHWYNLHRPHGGINASTPATRMNNLLGNDT